MDSFSEIWTIARHGGITLAVIAGFSLIALFVGIERALALWGVSEAGRKLTETVTRCLYRGDVVEARAACERSRAPLADVLLAAFSRISRAPPEAIAKAAERERATVLLRLRARLWLLGTIAATAPFVGLFGTVVGIMRAFKDMAAHPGGGFNIVAAGISEALVTTTAGIAVAIEAVILYNFFSARISTTMLEMKIAAEEVLELLFHGREAGHERELTAAEIAEAQAGARA